LAPDVPVHAVQVCRGAAEAGVDVFADQKLAQIFGRINRLIAVVCRRMMNQAVVLFAAWFS
jgi:hypothetical protein